MRSRLRRSKMGLIGGVFFLWAWIASAASAASPAGSPHQHRIQTQNPTRSQEEACPRRYLSDNPNVLACPSSNGITLLPSHYPPRTLFVGYDPNPHYLKFLTDLIERNAARKKPLQLVILIPRLDVAEAYNDLHALMKFPEARHLTFITTPSDETLWTQDYLELGISMNDGEAKIIDLPYADREGEWIPTALALSCQVELVPQVDQDPYGKLPEKGDYGGNIEALPGNFLLVGNTITQTTQKSLSQTLTNMTLVTVDVHWLDTGHVDELFTVLPNRGPKATCPFAMAYTSPELALSLIRTHGIRPFQDRISPEAVSLQDVSPELQDWEFFSSCLSRYTRNQSLAKRCQRLIQANLHYSQLIERDRQRLQAMLEQRKVCDKIPWIALPQLFVPSFERWLGDADWGSGADFAHAINPNSVNVIALGDELVIPQQPFAPFEREVERRLRPLGLSLIRINSSYSHYLNGGLHCNTSVARMCRPQTGQSPHSSKSRLR